MNAYKYVCASICFLSSKESAAFSLSLVWNWKLHYTSRKCTALEKTLTGKQSEWYESKASKFHFARWQVSRVLCWYETKGGLKGLQPYNLFAFIERFDRILAIILVPVAILQRITNLNERYYPIKEIYTLKIDSKCCFVSVCVCVWMGHRQYWINSTTAKWIYWIKCVRLVIRCSHFQYWIEDKFNSYRKCLRSVAVTCSFCVCVWRIQPYSQLQSDVWVHISQKPWVARLSRNVALHAIFSTTTAIYFLWC